jgi:predicted nuclease of predicted toxin-antitoxin system
VRFFLDHNVPVSVGTALRRLGHDCWTAAQAGLATEGQDDNLTVYAAERDAVLVTLDRRFMQRRQVNPIGRHIRLHCTEPEAARCLTRQLAEVLELLERDHVTITISQDAIKADSEWT